MEHITEYLIVFLVGIILGGIGSMSMWANRWPSRQMGYSAPVFTPYPVRTIPWFSIFVAVLIGLSIMFIAIGASRTGFGNTRPGREHRYEGSDFSPALYDLNK